MEQVITQIAVKILFEDYSGFYEMRRTIPENTREAEIILDFVYD